MPRVVRLWRDGKQVPRWQLAQLKVEVGELRIEACNDEHLRWYLRRASLYNFSQAPGNGSNVIPPLADAAVLWVSGNRMSISGFERDDLLQTYAQTWLVEVLPAEVTEGADVR